MMTFDRLHRNLAILLGLALALQVAPASAEDLIATGGKHWVTVASSQDKDQAIGIARLYAGQRARVVASKSGWLAVVFGPVEAASIAHFRKSYQDWPELPKDARLSRGETYTGTVWQPAEEVKPTEFGADRPAHLSVGGFDVVATLVKDGGNSSVTLTGKDGARDVFSLETASDAYADFGTSVQTARLDGAAPLPQVMVTRNTGGAHCCVETWIATGEGPQGWMLIDTGLLDGGGYQMEDIDSNGFAELLNYDNSFFYAFDSYAASFAPLRIKALTRDKLGDVTAQPQWRFRIAQDLAGMEFLAKMEPALWQSNGYLAAWVATKIELGEGTEAWRKMLKSYDHNSDFGSQICSTGQSVDDCPPDKLQQVPFPEGLAEHLKAHGYTPVPGG